MNKRAFTLSLETIIKVIIAVFVFLIILFIPAKLYGFLSSGPDSIQEENMKRIGVEINGLISEMGPDFVGKAHITIPLQLSEKFKVISFPKEAECHGNDCICLAKKDNLDKKYFCHEFKNLQISPVNFMPENNQLINVELIISRDEKGDSILLIIPSEIAKQDLEQYLYSDEETAETLFLDESGENSGQFDIKNYSPFGAEKIWPISSTFAKFRTLDSKPYYHAGIDFACPCGTNVYAVADGKATRLKNPGGYGDYVLMQHQNSVSTVYAHLSKILIETGQDVKKGDKIGISGNTGRGTGCHLHFEVRHPPGTAVNNYQVKNYAVNPAELPTLLG